MSSRHRRKRFFSYMLFCAAKGKGLDGFNQWPSRPEGFEATMREYFATMEVLARKLTCAMALGLDLPAEHFAKEFDGNHSSYLRLNYYPTCPEVRE